MGRTGAALAVVAVAAAVVVGLSGGSRADPRTPSGPPGLPAPLLGTSVVGDGGRTEAVDSFGDVVEVTAAGPAGRALLDVPAARQDAGSVSSASAIVARVNLAGRQLPLWRADSVRQRFLAGTNTLLTEARFGRFRASVVRSIGGGAAERAERRWVARARPLGAGAPSWARGMYERSLLVVRALTDPRTGAVAAGAREGWAYVWPRDASAVAIALAAAGYRGEARRVVGFLRRLRLESAARFSGSGSPVPGRAPAGDAAGWVAAAARAAGLPAPRKTLPWRGRPDYQEGEAGDYLGNAIAAGVSAARIRALFATGRGLERGARNPASGLDSAAAWAVRPFPRPTLFPLIRRSLRRLVADQGRFGILPSEDWPDGEPWTAPTAWTAWSLAALGERGPALRLMGDLRRDSTEAGMLPERVGARTGLPRSTTPLVWSHAFAILALRQLWPSPRGS
jgi:Glycosyl hydrolases family 15